MKTAEWIDGMGESGLAQLVGLWRKLNLDDMLQGRRAYFMVYRVPLAASEEEHRALKARYDRPPTWKQIREEYGVGRYEVVLMGPPPEVEVGGWRGEVKRLAYQFCPWLDNGNTTVPRGRACAAMFDTIDFGMVKPPMPKPISDGTQGSLFNKKDVDIPKYAAGSDTSFLAAEAIAPMVTKLQRKVLQAALAAGTNGVTCDEAEMVLGMSHQTASARVNELSQERIDRKGEIHPQMLFDSGSRRKTRHGQLAIVWVHKQVLFG